MQRGSFADRFVDGNGGFLSSARPPGDQTPQLGVLRRLVLSARCRSLAAESRSLTGVVLRPQGIAGAR